MLFLMGDTHGNFGVFEQLSKGFEEDNTLDKVTILHVGDFGFYPNLIKYFHSEVPVYAIDGNHENFEWLYNMRSGETGIVEIKKNLFHVPRGHILELYGWKIGCCGGAESIDVAYRQNRISWWAEEKVHDSDWAPLVDAEFDFLVTHCPPTEAIDALFPKLQTDDWGLPPLWKDLSAESIQRLWEAKNRMQLYCGHMHKKRTYKTVRILDINELIPIKPKEV